MSAASLTSNSNHYVGIGLKHWLGVKHFALWQGVRQVSQPSQSRPPHRSWREWGAGGSAPSRSAATAAQASQRHTERALSLPMSLSKVGRELQAAVRWGNLLRCSGLREVLLLSPLILVGFTFSWSRACLQIWVPLDTAMAMLVPPTVC